MAYSCALAEYGRTLATRPLGREIRTDLTHKAADEDLVVLDFSGVASTSHSFADEFVATLAEEIQQGTVDFAVSMAGASGEVERVVRKALERREVPLPVPA